MPLNNDSYQEIIRNEKEVRRAFLKYLQTEKGYPDESILSEISLAHGVRPDLTIIDPNSREFIAIIEFKGTNNLSKNRINLKQQLLSYQAAAGNLGLPVFLVVPSYEVETIYDFSILQTDKEEVFVEIDPEDFPQFEALSAAAINKSLSKAENNQKQVIERFSFYSYLLAIALLALFFFAVLGWWKPTWELLSLVAGATVLVILPHIKRLKIFGLEVERLEKSK